MEPKTIEERFNALQGWESTVEDQINEIFAAEPNIEQGAKKALELIGFLFIEDWLEAARAAIDCCIKKEVFASSNKTWIEVVLLDERRTIQEAIEFLFENDVFIGKYEN
jgi:hypothetical protein